MRTAHELLGLIAQRVEPRPFTCDGGVVVCPDGSIVRGTECMSGLATDAAPRDEPTFQTTGWMTTIEPSKSAMDEASRRAECFAGVTYSEGQRRLADYLARHEGSNNA